MSIHCIFYSFNHFIYITTCIFVENVSCIGVNGQCLILGDDIIEDAKKRINSDSASFEATIEKLEQTRLLLEKDREEAARKLRQAEENAKKASFLKAELEVRLEKADEKSRREAERIIAECIDAYNEKFVKE